MRSMRLLLLLLLAVTTAAWPSLRRRRTVRGWGPRPKTNRRPQGTCPHQTLKLLSKPTKNTGSAIASDNLRVNDDGGRDDHSCQLPGPGPNEGRLSRGHIRECFSADGCQKCVCACLWTGELSVMFCVDSAKCRTRTEGTSL